jgi:hypothetical protein
VTITSSTRNIFSLFLFLVSLYHRRKHLHLQQPVQQQQPHFLFTTRSHEKWLRCIERRLVYLFLLLSTRFLSLCVWGLAE